ncbi:ATP-grasp domain-containing protein [Actinokineospora enzanensis]|uniref:ATP-grasp domain-containing protein n=1 Tax=Actinokineospora enzanensis TaxID=155975 RepID=UPI00037801A8|nr:hypothetical protein [Actinokineospora enzanensis]
MSVLILHLRNSLKDTPYDRWLADYDGDLLLLASREHLELGGEELPGPDSGYTHVEAISGYQFGGGVEARVLELARKYDIRHIIAPQEQDLERAARLREILDLPGQRYESVLPYRNKMLMKDTVRAAGVEVAAYRDLECALDLLTFADEHGYPVVVKPRDGAGSLGVRILRTPEALHAFLADEGEPIIGGHGNLKVENFVSETMCHVDGLVVDGQMIYAWPSQYLYALAAFQGDRGGRLDVTLDADDPLTPRLLDCADKCIAALPAPRDFAFHAEIFHTEDDRVVLGEIACRTGGAAQRDIQRALFDIDPTEAWIRAQVGLPLPFTPGAPRLVPLTLTGQLALLKRPGVVEEMPGEPPFDWVRKQNLFIRAGDVLDEPAYAADFLVTYVIAAPTRAESVRRMRELEDWFLGALRLGAGGVEPTARRARLAGMSEGTGNAR